MELSWDDFPLRQVVEAALAGRGQQWRLREDDRWCYVDPPHHAARSQGWKLHVSATVQSAPLVLYQAARVLAEHDCAFKYAASLHRVRELTSKHTDRAQVGKFITAYPRDDDHLRTLAPLLDRATAGLPGPQVPSDRPYRPGSLVHYRYGAFAGVPVLTHEGAYEVWLEAPDGTLVEDPRQPWFCPPAWAQPPYPGPAVHAPQPPAQPKSVVLHDRYRVEKAIRHSAVGGVYRAVDLRTGERVVIKQARAHVSGLTLGDARDGLRRESQMLALLTGLAPAEVELFGQGDDLYLVLEELDGQPLSTWVHHRWQPAAPDGGEEGPPVAEAVEVADRVAEVVAAVHARGLVIRDLSPGNVMVLADGTVKLVDAELVARPGEWVMRAHTPGFAAPEVVAGSGVGPAPDQPADLYSLGVVLLQLATGTAPPQVTGAADHAAAESGPATVDRLVRYASARNPAVRRLAPAVRGLTAADPRQRWSLSRLREYLAGPPAEVPGDPPPARLDAGRQQLLLDDGLAYLLAGIDARAASERIVPHAGFSGNSDPCNVQHGAAGVLEVLVRASERYGTEALRQTVTRLARWVDRRRMAVPRLLPGLYYGRAGTAWALYSAACHLGDTGMADRALELAVALPVRWSNPDLTHGTAGVGLASLRLWLETKEPVLRERMVAAAEHIRQQVSYTEQGHVYWRVPPDGGSRLAGVAHLGFAHGVAGIGAFLLAVASHGGCDEFRELALQSGQTLAATAVRHDGAAYWPNSISGPDPGDLRYHWCSGASGVGTFLVRLWQATGQERWRQLAHEAAVSVYQGRWLGGMSSCHGLAGNGEFLLDFDQASGGQGPYRGWAEELAAVLYARRTRRGGRVIAGDEIHELNLDYGTGLAGVVGFMFRLRNGGPRWWMAEESSPAAV